MKSQIKEEEYNLCPNKCLFCGKNIPFDKRKNDCCSRSCACSYSNNKRYKNGFRPNSEKISKTMKEKIKNGEIKLEMHKNKKQKNKKNCLICNKEFHVYNSEKNRIYCSRECYNNDKNKPKYSCGGYRERSGRGKSGWYKGYFCQSSYELAYVIYNIDNKIKFERNLEGFLYYFEGKAHKYYPDFIVDGSYVEIKGYMTSQVKAKCDQFVGKLIFIGKKEIKKYIEYCVSTYGKKFVEMYEDNPYKEVRNNICKQCGNPCKNVFCSRSCAGKHRAMIKHNK